MRPNKPQLKPILVAEGVRKVYTIVARSDAMGDLRFAVPIAQLSILLVATVAASLLATVAPALSATRIRPAVALRMTDS